ncbi:MAG: hypothetical protein K8S99_16700 [Planctomycetes bacterium]|nr:hypothetical protein [Planctomycetota bacterium]
MAGLRDGKLEIRDVGAAMAVLSVQCWLNGEWRAAPLAANGDAFTAAAGGAAVRLRLKAAGDGEWSYDLSLESNEPTRVRLMLEARGAVGVFHLIPGVIHGDNNLPHAEPGHFPNLTALHPGNVSCAAYWEMRADRASHPVSILCADGLVAAVSATPYLDTPPSNARPDEAFVRNGLFAMLAHDDQPDACGATLGYRNDPRTFLNKDQWLDATQHLLTRGTMSGRIFAQPAASRLDAHRVVRRVYADHHEVPPTPISQREAAQALTRALLDVNWHDENGATVAGTVSGQASAFLGGGGLRENFTNMRCVDPEKKKLTAWRTLAEVGWTGGGVIGYPVLLAGHALGDDTAVRRGVTMLDRVADAFNPDSGLLWDVNGPHEGKRLNWWWSGYLVKDCHCAYTNGSAVYYLLKALTFSRTAMKRDHPRWLETARKVLDTMLRLQLPDGGFGFTYRADRPEVIDAQGFAGAWFIPAMVYAHRLTGEKKYLDSAARGAAHYHSFVRDLSCWGTPMDTWKAVDQEGNLAFLRGARLLHETTGDPAHLGMLTDAANYEYLWRYGFRARPEYPPLKGSHWSSVGGSTTSVSNPHIHPMGVYVSADLDYLAKKTGDAYHASRRDDGVRWGVNIVSLYPAVSGYGVPGVITERFCPSDGLTVETFPDGSPSSLWFSYNGWAAAGVLEGLVETLPS